MIAFNIIGAGVLEVGKDFNVQFTRENIFYRFNEISLGRSVEFDAPATDHNRKVLGFADDFTEYGESCRRFLPCEMQYDGGCDRGRLEVTGYASGAFKCIYYMSYDDKLEKIMNKPLSDCNIYSSFKPRQYQESPTNADSATPALGNQTLLYENGLTGAGATKLVPSINVKKFCEEVLKGEGYSAPLIDIDDDYWLVAGSINGGGTDDIDLDQISTNSATVTPAVNNYLDVADITLEWASLYIAGNYYGGGSVASKGFRAKTNITLKFPATFPTGVYLVQWSSKLGNCMTIGGVAADGTGDYHTADGNPSPSLRGVTVNVPKGSIFFFAENKFYNLPANEYGYRDTKNPFTVQVAATQNGDLVAGEKWDIRNNMPDMTLIEFLCQIALATGNDIAIDSNVWIGNHGNDDQTKLDNVTEVESVSRCVGCWGEDTKVARIKFDSADYVTQPIVTAYAVDSERISGESDHVVGFSEGLIGTNGVLIPDMEYNSDDNKYEFKGSKWTLTRALSGFNYLQRTDQPSLEYCDVIADASTCVVVSFAESLADFLARRYTAWVMFRGGQFVWTDCVWSGGVTRLTLQKV